MSEIIDNEVVGVSFGFYTEREIHALSVCRVLHGHGYDTLGQPVPNGLYDPRMGPIDRDDTCVTCLQSQSHCLGHLGHLSLALPVYQPLLLDLTVKLFKAKCWRCHAFKLAKLKIKLTLTKLQLIEAGLLHHAQELEEMDATSTSHKMLIKDTNSVAKRVSDKQKKKSTKKKSNSSNPFIDDEAAEGDESEDDNDSDRASESNAVAANTSAAASQRSHESAMSMRLNSLLKLARNTHDRHMALHGAPPPLTSAALLHRSDIIASFMRELTAQKACANCGAFSPKIRKDGFNKLFRLPLGRKEQDKMNFMGIELQYNILGDLNKRDYAGEAKAIKRSATTGGKKGSNVSKGNDSSDDESDDSDTESSDEENPRAVKPSADSDDIIDTDANANTAKSLVIELNDSKRSPVLLFPTEVEKHFELLWEREISILSHLWGCLFNQPRMVKSPTPVNHQMFFIHSLAVPPSRFRPPTKYADMVMEHPHNAYLKNILDLDARLRSLTSATVKDWPTIIESWIGLQNELNMLLDSSKGPNPSLNPNNGIRQTFEKKEGLFRRNMMGKRVNFAARSVISPDPFLNTNEIGVPELFATELTFPEPVTQFNVQSLRQAVINGSSVYPGANYIEDERGHLINLSTRSSQQRIALANTLLTSSANISPQSVKPIQSKRVLRHIRTGDVMLVNRQPTLHKPSMMTHRVRVLRGRNKMWQTIRMHYVNCNSYNADFDGDEMNLHVPQNQLARAEAYHISNTDHQYVVPTDGSPLRGLIQDNVLTGVLLTSLETFLTKAQFQQLLFSSVEVDPILPLPTPTPTILKPRPLYSGKQLISSILNLLTHGRPPLNLDSKAKIPAMHWAQHKEEARVIIRNNELLTGALDKSQFGDAGYGLVHAVYEIYGASTAGQLLSTLGRLFTLYLQTQAFTCGIDDMLLVEASEKQRQSLIQESVVTGIKTAAEFAGLDADHLDIYSQSINKALQSTIRSDPKAVARLDGAMKGSLNPFTTKIFNACLPVGQYKSFPMNGMSLMTLSGAKGSAVNFYQISCLLGQQELEGKRVPAMATGRTLPSFRRYDPQPRAGGYVTDRFLTGIRPQEYFFHCMAGREGLIDTAVKTSRSGYLQRCLIKHLESLCVQYDYTVRDADASIVQFHYGEDSIDVSRTAYLNHFSFLTQNWLPLIHRLNPSAAVRALDVDSVDEYKASHANNDDFDPVLAKFPPGSHLGSISESFEREMEDYITKDPDGVFARSSKPQARSSRTQPLVTPDKFRALMKLYYLSSLVQPGESVGILAAQSLGEPSTQMTLNTFHLAGHGGANVTLGIPRLREIIMTASAKIKTPIMEAPMLPQFNQKELAENIAAALNRLPLSQFIENVSVKETVTASKGGEALRVYTVRVQFLAQSHSVMKSNRIDFYDLRNCFVGQFVPTLHTVVKKEIKIARKSHAVTPVIVSSKQGNDYDDDTNTGKLKGGNTDAVTEKEREKHSEKISYDGPDDEERQLLREQDNAQSDDDDDDSNEPSRSQSQANDNDNGSDNESDEDSEPSPAESLESSVLSRCVYARTIRNDIDSRWCEVDFGVSLSLPKLLMMSMTETALEKSVLRSTPGITKSFVVEKQCLGGDKRWTVQTDGVNLQHLRYYADSLDLNLIYSNDVAALLREYGVEAARSSIMNEVAAVFKPYGISVDLRHLSLIADYMTMNGDYRALNRGGIDGNASAFQKMSFETSMHFMRQACLTGDTDYLTSPSACIVMGKPVKSGTGAFTLLQPLNTAQQTNTK